MTVQELINKLKRVQDKSKIIKINVDGVDWTCKSVDEEILSVVLK